MTERAKRAKRVSYGYMPKNFLDHLLVCYESSRHDVRTAKKQVLELFPEWGHLTIWQFGNLIRRHRETLTKIREAMSTPVLPPPVHNLLPPSPPKSPVADSETSAMQFIIKLKSQISPEAFKRMLQLGNFLLSEDKVPK